MRGVCLSKFTQSLFVLIIQDSRPVPLPDKTKEDILLFFKLYDPVKEELRYFFFGICLDKIFLLMLFSFTNSGTWVGSLSGHLGSLLKF